MRGLLTIAAKDFKVLVTSPLYFLVTFFCTCLWSFTYLRSMVSFATRSQGMMMRGAPEGLNIHYELFLQHISFVNIIFIFALPALTMRLISEEKKMRTYDLLLTAPVTATDIAIGKFLAGFGAALFLVLVSFIYPVGTSFFAEFPWQPLWVAYLGLALMTGVYVAVGLFCSSLTSSVFLSVFLGVILNLVMWFIGQATEFSDNPLVTSVIEHLSVGQHMFTFLKGTITLSSMIFFLSAMGLFVFLTQRVVESSRWR